MEWASQAEWEAWAEQAGFHERVVPGLRGRFVMAVRLQHPDGHVHTCYLLTDRPEDPAVLADIARHVIGYRRWVCTDATYEVRIGQLGFGPVPKEGQPNLDLEAREANWNPRRWMTIVPGTLVLPAAHYEADGATYWPPEIAMEGRHKARLRVAINIHLKRPQLPDPRLKLLQPRDVDHDRYASETPRDYVHPIMIHESTKKGIIAFVVNIPEENVMQGQYGAHYLVNAVGRVVTVTPRCLTLRCEPVDLGHYAVSAEQAST